jgi:hypothetical protein
MYGKKRVEGVYDYVAGCYYEFSSNIMQYLCDAPINVWTLIHESIKDQYGAVRLFFLTFFSSSITPFDAATNFSLYCQVGKIFSSKGTVSRSKLAKYEAPFWKISFPFWSIYFNIEIWWCHNLRLHAQIIRNIWMSLSWVIGHWFKFQLIVYCPHL